MMGFVKSTAIGVALTVTGTLALAAPANAAGKKEPIALARCSASLGTIAVVDGDQAGWAKYGLGSPRELINALAVESGCFTPQTPGSNAPVRFLMTAIAGDKEEVDQGIERAKGAAVEGLIRSGAAGNLLGNVPLAGGILGGLGGLGGKKKTIAAGLKVVLPSSGMTIASGTGSVTKTSITFGGLGGLGGGLAGGLANGVANAASGWMSGANASGYASSKDGQMLIEAFIGAFNQIVSQQAALAAVPQAAAPVTASAPASAAALATVAVDTSLWARPAKGGAAVRALRAGTTLTPTGKREGLFVEVTDNFGTKGWVSVEDLR